MKSLTKLEAIEWLIKNKRNYPINEWYEAGLWKAVNEIMELEDEEILTDQYLEELLEKAHNY